MKRDLFIILAVVVVCGSCKKSSPAPSTASDSYFPLTTGSSWAYLDVEQGLNPDTATTQITGATTVFNNKTYYNAATSSKNKGLGTDYFYTGQHVYTIRSLNAYAGEIIELQLYCDTASVGISSYGVPTDSGDIEGLPVRTVNTIIAKDIPLLLNGVHYPNVVHSRVDFQYDYKTGNGFETNFTYDFYLAKGIGMIAYDLNILGSTTEQEVLLKYSAK